VSKKQTDLQVIRTTPQTCDVPPIPRLKLGPRKRKAKGRPLTQTERDALRFEAIKVDFDWSNEDWAVAWLPWVRLAISILHLDDEEHKEGAVETIRAGNMPMLLEGLARTEGHLEGLYKALRAALNRSFLTVERLGYTPETLPEERTSLQ
jgi:hypothetical protein